MYNYQIDREKWAALTILEQMGNAGSEVGRALAAKRRGDNDRARAALYRGLDLLDATAAVWAAKKSPRTREILRAREQFISAVMEQDDPALEDYFMQFALAARMKRQTA
ncbi:MAG TPA: hypothetical protein VHC98_00375 [Candidatus Saccharimonadales bacterium]|nr:hypothetical protein [Candidatus Saccharimonadales bacterium]